MKFKFNLKLTVFLVSLFLGLLLVILGSKNKYCLSFGFIVIGASLVFFVNYNNERIQNELAELGMQIDELEADEEINETDRVYILKQLYVRQHKLNKKSKSSKLLFYICGVSLVFLGIFGMF